MYEWEFINEQTNEHIILQGHNLSRAMLAAGLNETEWKLVYTENIDDDWFAYE